MNFFFNNYYVTIPKELRYDLDEKLQQFVKRMAAIGQSADYYTKYRNANRRNALNNIYLGKKAEYLVALALKQVFDYPFIEPDFSIYNRKNKGWKADLPFHEIKENLPNIHVKACNRETFRNCGDFSWTFQYSNNTGFGGKDKLLETHSNDLVALVFMEKENSDSGTIKSLLPFSKLQPLLKDPQKPNLVGLKKCIYYNDLEQASGKFAISEKKIRIIKGSR